MQNKYETKLEETEKRIVEMLLDIGLERGYQFDKLMTLSVEMYQNGSTYRAIELHIRELIYNQGGL